MRSSLGFVSALCGSAIAQTSVTIYLPEYLEEQTRYTHNATATVNYTPQVSIKHNYPSTTEMVLGCPSAVPTTDCAWGTGFDYTIISGNTFIAKYSIPTPAFKIDYTCVHQPGDSDINCAFNNSNEGGGQMTADNVYESVPWDFVPAAVTGGAELLKTTEAPPNTSATPSASPVSGQSNASGAIPSATASLSSPASAESTGAAARPLVGASSFLVMAGAVVATW